MPTAILYIRVSTDEQAIKGYSQRYQKDHLERYCLSNSIDILEIIYEDFSAKNFERPEWKMLMAELRSKRSKRPDYLLFTKWDRFSRNAGDAYYVISQLHSMGISPQAIDQKLDLSIPENKIILGVYLATSEAENERRSINVKEGIHRARQEGRWTAHVPFGYRYKLIENNQKVICLKEPEAIYVVQAFDMVLEQHHSVKAIYDYFKVRGLRCSPNTFRRIFRNPFYCGKVYVPEFKEEKAQWVRGNHEGLIDEVRFLKVQQVLDSRHKQKIIIRKNSEECMILRGFVLCPRCNKKLTGSWSKGKTRYYPYYHCTSQCGFRLRADKINMQLNEKLKTIHINKVFIDLYKRIVRYVRKDLHEAEVSRSKILSQSIDRHIERIIRAKQLLLQNEIQYEDYILIKRDCESKIHGFGKGLNCATERNARSREIINNAVQAIDNIQLTYNQIGIEEKKRLLRIVLDENLVINEEIGLTEIFSPTVQSIFQISSIGHVPADNHKNKKAKLHTEYTQFVEEVKAIIHHKNKSVLHEDAQKIVLFLMEFGKLSASNSS